MPRFRLPAALALGLALPLLASLVALAPAGATPRADNPLAGREWGVYQGAAEMAWLPYTLATDDPVWTREERGTAYALRS